MLSLAPLLALAITALAAPTERDGVPTVQVHPGDNKEWCLATIDNSTIGLRRCNTCDEAVNVRWSVQNWTTRMQSFGTGLCAEGGVTPRRGPYLYFPSNGRWVGLLQCYDGYQAGMEWQWDQGRFVVADKGENGQQYCLDLADGDVSEDAYLQLWDCASTPDGNPNQIWSTTSAYY